MKNGMFEKLIRDARALGLGIKVSGFISANVTAGVTEIARSSYVFKTQLIRRKRFAKEVFHYYFNERPRAYSH